MSKKKLHPGGKMSFEGFVRERLENVKKFFSWLVFEFKQKLPYPELGTYSTTYTCS